MLLCIAASRRPRHLGLSISHWKPKGQARSRRQKQHAPSHDRKMTWYARQLHLLLLLLSWLHAAQSALLRLRKKMTNVSRLNSYSSYGQANYLQETHSTSI